MVYHTIFIKTFIVFCLFNLTLLLLTKDPAIEWNPGPGDYKKVTYTSDKEKKLFQCLRSINNDIAHISSHQQFMAHCKELNIIPKGFQQKISLSVVKPDEKLFEKIDKTTSFSNTQIQDNIMNHYNELLPVLLCRKQQADNELLNVSRKGQYTYLSNILNSIAEKDMQLLQGTKIKKLNTLVDVRLHL